MESGFFWSYNKEKHAKKALTLLFKDQKDLILTVKQLSFN